MSRWGQITRIDKVQKVIVEVLRKRGFKVYIIGKPVDLLIAKSGKDGFAEVKNPYSKNWEDEYTPAQKKFFAGWEGRPIPTLRSIEDALNFELP